MYAHFSIKTNVNNVLLLLHLEITSFHYSIYLHVLLTQMQLFLTFHLLPFAFFLPPTQIKDKVLEIIESCSTSYGLPMSC